MTEAKQEGYYFGVLRPGEAGHYLYDQYLTRDRSLDVHLGFRASILDCGLLPHSQSDLERQKEGVPHVAIIHNRWYVISFWDRTGDKRGGSTSSFVVPYQGRDSTYEQHLLMAREIFPMIWERFPANWEIVRQVVKAIAVATQSFLEYSENAQH